MGIKNTATIKEFTSNVENFEEYERKFHANNDNRNRNNYKGNFRKHQNKKNMCRIPGHDHEWKDCPKNRYNTVKKEENNNISDDSSDSSSDESMRMMDYDSVSDEEDLKITELLIKYVDCDDSNNSDEEDTNIPQIVIRKDYSREEESDDDNEYEELHETRSKHKKSVSWANEEKYKEEIATLGSEILMPAKVAENE